VNEELHAAAVIAACNTVLTPRAAYDLDTLHKMPTKPPQYVEVSVTRRYIDGGVIGTEKSIVGARLVTRYVADTITNARVLRSDCRAALESATLTIEGVPTTPLQFETALPIYPDSPPEVEGYSGLDSWTYCH
jgi:hypothetical protein